MNETKNQNNIKSNQVSTFFSSNTEAKIQNEKLKSQIIKETKRRNCNGILFLLLMKFNVFNSVVYSWGYGKPYGIGHGDLSDAMNPEIIALFNSIRILTISAGLSHVLLLSETHGCYAFGNGSNGQLGMGDTFDRLKPCRISALDSYDIIQLEAGGNFSIALIGQDINTRNVLTWGCGKNGCLGTGSKNDQFIPTKVDEFVNKKIAKVSAGICHCLALTDASHPIKYKGHLWSWGCNAYGQLAQKKLRDQSIPKPLAIFSDIRFKGISAGERHSIAYTDDKIYIWGLSDIDSNKRPYINMIFDPKEIKFEGLNIQGCLASYGRSYVWGDRDNINKSISCSNSLNDICDGFLKKENIRILYTCKSCCITNMCIPCGKVCHKNHCIQVDWKYANTIIEKCPCNSNMKCKFYTKRNEL